MREHGHGSALDEVQACFKQRALAALSRAATSANGAQWMAGTDDRP
jgi:hypothetical protein